MARIQAAPVSRGEVRPGPPDGAVTFFRGSYRSLVRTVRYCGADPHEAEDGFGTGYSNLAYLRDLPVHGLKLAGQFIHGSRGDIDDAILTALVELGGTLGLTVTAQGVETRAQVDRLRAAGCDFGQGFHFGRPTPGLPRSPGKGVRGRHDTAPVPLESVF
jgi:EAL domain-containing protein (putative c-di-GMP-specific phosphodiesterase class I)